MLYQYCYIYVSNSQPNIITLLCWWDVCWLPWFRIKSEALGFGHLEASFSNLLWSPWTQLINWVMLWLNKPNYHSITHRSSHLGARGWECTPAQWVPCPLQSFVPLPSWMPSKPPEHRVIGFLFASSRPSWYKNSEWLHLTPFQLPPNKHETNDNKYNYLHWCKVGG